MLLRYFIIIIGVDSQLLFTLGLSNSFSKFQCLVCSKDLKGYVDIDTPGFRGREVLLEVAGDL